MSIYITILHENILAIFGRINYFCSRLFGDGSKGQANQIIRSLYDISI
jgi:hypothetical protein